MVKERIIGCIRKVWPVALKTSCWFLKIMLPVSFVVMLLTYFQVLPAVSAVVAPLFTRIGLPGDAALVFVTGIFTNIYTVIALLSNMDFTVREGILLAMMCLISHNYPVETLVQKKTGSAGWKMVLLRFTCSFIAAAVLNLILPEFAGRMIAQPSVDLGFRDTLFNWLQTSLWLSLKVVALITGLMILQRLLEEFGILKWISSLLGPGMQLLGLPRQGLAYGSAVLMDYARQGKLTGTEADLLNYHLAISHSQLEDPLLFAVLGLPVVWLIVPRILLAFIVVWLKRLADFIFPAQAMALSQKI